MPKTIEKTTKPAFEHRLKAAYATGEATANAMSEAIEREPDVVAARAALKALAPISEELSRREATLSAEELRCRRLADPTQLQETAVDVDIVEVMRAKDRLPDVIRERTRLAIEITEQAAKRDRARAALASALTHHTEARLRALISIQADSLIGHIPHDHAVRVLQGRLHSQTRAFFEAHSWADLSPTLADGTWTSRIENWLRRLRDEYRLLVE